MAYCLYLVRSIRIITLILNVQIQFFLSKDNHRNPYWWGSHRCHRSKDATVLSLWKYCQPNKQNRNYWRKRKDQCFWIYLQVSDVLFLLVLASWNKSLCQHTIKVVLDLEVTVLLQPLFDCEFSWNCMANWCIYDIRLFICKYNNDIEIDLSIWIVCSHTCSMFNILHTVWHPCKVHSFACFLFQFQVSYDTRKFRSSVPPGVQRSSFHEGQKRANAGLVFVQKECRDRGMSN